MVVIPSEVQSCFSTFHLKHILALLSGSLFEGFWSGLMSQKA